MQPQVVEGEGFQFRTKAEDLSLTFFVWLKKVGRAFGVAIV